VRDFAAWLLLARLASIWAVSALLGVITIEFFQATAGYVLLLSALTSTTLLAIHEIVARRRRRSINSSKKLLSNGRIERITAL
jgi:hypothetical protein